MMMLVIICERRIGLSYSAWNVPGLCDFSTKRRDLIEVLPWGRGSEVALMSPVYSLSFCRRVERLWAESIKSLRQIRDNSTLRASISSGGDGKAVFDHEGLRL
jgi:hypothetical protein